MLKDISVEEAVSIILENTNILSQEKVFINEALGRVIAEDIFAPYNIPFYDNSAMDGYAVKFSDTLQATNSNPVKLKLIGEIPAGKLPDFKLNSGEAAKIMTGGIIPDGSDAVVRKEITEEKEGFVYILEPVSKEKDLRKAGEDIKQGEMIIEKNSNITPAIMGLLASVGKSYIKVYRKPVVSVIITGSEILEIDEPYEKGKIRNSNSFTLLGLLQKENVIIRLCEIVKDDKETTFNAIKENLDSDIILSTGGVSMGDYDFVKDVVIALGFEPLFWRVRVKPGKPLFFAKNNRSLYFGIPGNPVSTMTTFYNFILPSLRKMKGSKELDLFTVSAILEEDIKRKDLRAEFIRGILYKKQNKFFVKTTGPQGSGILSSMVKGNCFIYIDENRDSVKKGDIVTVKLFTF